MATNPLHKAIKDAMGEEDSARAVELVLDGADVDEKDSQGRTPLHIVAEYLSSEFLENDRADILSALLGEHANVNAKDNQGRTPLHIGAMKDNHHLVLALVKFEDPDKTIRDNSGKLAVDYAAPGSEVSKILQPKTAGKRKRRTYRRKIRKVKKTRKVFH